jgi:hypothetical protein
MSDPCSCPVLTACALAFLAALVTIIMSARLLRYVLRESKRLRDRADLELRISQAVTRPDGGRSAVLPPAPRPPR